MPSAAEYVRAAAREGIGPKSALLEHAALTRDLALTRWSSREVLIEAPKWRYPIFFHQMNGPRSIGGRFYCDEKAVARDLLSRAGLKVATSRTFDPGDLREALRWAESVGYPVVAKPTNAARGRGVTANIQAPEALVTAWHRARAPWLNPLLRGTVSLARSLRGASAPRRAGSWPARVAAYAGVIRDAGSTAWKRRWSPVLMEKHFEGSDFRAFVVGDDIVSVTQRKPANVVGDGRATVLELIERKNLVRARNAYLSEYPIPTRPEPLDLLARAGLTMSDIPPAGELVVLRSASNLSAGGDSIDFTEEAHPGFLDIPIRAVRAIPGVEYAGVDLITPDITAPPTDANYIVSEVEFSPAPLAHFPLVGAGRDMAGAVLDHYLAYGAGRAA